MALDSGDVAIDIEGDVDLDSDEEEQSKIGDDDDFFSDVDNDE